MPSCIEILRFLLCCDDEQSRDHIDVDRWLRIAPLNYNRNSNPIDYHRVPSADILPRTVAPATATVSRIPSTPFKHSFNERIQRTPFKNPTLSAASFIYALENSNKKTHVEIEEGSSRNSVLKNLPENSNPDFSSSSSSSSTFSHVKVPAFSSPSTTIPQTSARSSEVHQKPKTSNSDSKKIIEQHPSHTNLCSISVDPSPFSPTLPPRPSSSSSSSSSSSREPLSSPKPSKHFTKPTLSLAPSNQTNQRAAASKYIWVQKNPSPLYVIPEVIREFIKNDRVPEVLKKPLSASTYKDYFAALLYAEDFYVEKWSDFQLFNVNLKLQTAEIYGKSYRYKNKVNYDDDKVDRIFVEFELDAVRERRPFLLSRDFALVRPSGSRGEPFQGIIYRVVRSNHVLVEFGDDFLSQHEPNCKYDVSFSFNRVCLKRAHQAVAAASDPLFRGFLFPEVHTRSLSGLPRFPISYGIDGKKATAVHHILQLQSQPPYLLEGLTFIIDPDSGSKKLSWTGQVLREAIFQIIRNNSSPRVLVCAPINHTCDLFMRSMKAGISESDMFRANAAFREIDGVPEDILPSCVYQGECFTCPSLQKLKDFKVILSTFVSSFRLYNEGVAGGHFSHIFLLDASFATEPEAMVVLANLATEKTAVVVSGVPGGRSSHVRSDIGRKHGLLTSYYERLCNSELYKSRDPTMITTL